MHDTVNLERRGTPTVAVGTTPFTDEAIEQASALGMPAYRLLEVPHPVQPLPSSRVADFADDVTEEIVRRLTDDAWAAGANRP